MKKPTKVCLQSNGFVGAAAVGVGRWVVTAVAGRVAVIIRVQWKLQCGGRTDPLTSPRRSLFVANAETPEYDCPMLLNDIITLATDETASLSRLLRKCIVLADQIRNERLKNWADQELNGYPESHELPDYRILPPNIKETFVGPFGSGSTHWPLPSISVKENRRERAEEVCLTDPVSVYEALIKEAEAIKCRSPRFETPSEIFTYYRRKLAPSQRGMVLVGATQEVPKSALIAVLENVRTRTLNIAVDIKGELGDRDEDLERVTPDQAARIEQKIIKIIYGGTPGNPE